MTFYETRARSLINRVAGDRSSLPFEYTISRGPVPADARHHQRADRGREPVLDPDPALASAGAVSVIPLVLHLRPGAREWCLSWLAQQHPEPVPLYERLHRGRAYVRADYQR